MNIKEISKKYNISPETLRYYERMGILPRVNRNQNGYRDYTKKDEQRIHYIRALRKAGVSIEAIVEYVTLMQKGSGTREMRKNILLAERNRIENEIKNMNLVLDYLNLKIKNYDDFIPRCESDFKI